MSLSSWTYVPQGSSTGNPKDYGPTEYSEDLLSGTLSLSPGNSSLTRTFYINQLYLPYFVDAVLGYATVDNDDKVSRPSLPDPHPVWSNLYAQELGTINIGLGDLTQYPNKTAAAQVAKVPVVYKPLDYDVTADDTGQDYELYRFVSRQTMYAGEFFTVNGTSMKYVASDKVLNIPPSKISGSAQLVYTWHNVPVNPAESKFLVPNWMNVEECLGKINSEVFDEDGYDCPAGTVLFLGQEHRLNASRITPAISGSNWMYDITMTFLYRNQGFDEDYNLHAGHNFLWDQANKWWDLITDNGQAEGKTLYDETDLNTLFSITL